MANTISLSWDVNLDDTATLTDGTTFTSPLRNAVGVFVKIFKVDSSSVQTEIANTGDTSDPETDQEFTITLTDDGWYQTYYVAVPDYDVLVTYAQYDAVFDPSTNYVYRSKSGSNIGQLVTNTTYFELITDPATLAANEGQTNESANIDSSVYNALLLNEVEDLFGDSGVASAKECSCNCDECSEAEQLFAFVDAQREGALIHAGRQQFASAERCIRRLDEFID
jgi:hypothetical protein